MHCVALFFFSPSLQFARAQRPFIGNAAHFIKLVVKLFRLDFGAQHWQE
jgi:hypothetical protein